MDREGEERAVNETAEFQTESGVCLSPMRSRGGSSEGQMENGDGYGRMSGWAIHASRQSSSQNRPGVNTMSCRLAINSGSQKLIRATVRRGIETIRDETASVDKINHSDPQTSLGHRHALYVTKP